MDVYPGDKIVIYKAILWLGAAAVFFLPKVVIPLRTVDNPNQRAKYFPDIGYDQYEGYWIKTRTTFGKDQYFYGYYVVNFFTKVGLGLGYVAFYQKKNGRRSANVNFYEIHDRRVNQSTDNLTLNETENISQTLRANFALGYQSNFGPYTNLPANTNINATVAHQTQHASQQYSFSRSAVGSQSSSDSFSFTDNQQFNQSLSNALNFTLRRSSSNFGGIGSSNSTATFDNLTHLTTAGADYQLTIDKTHRPRSVRHRQATRAADSSVQVLSALRHSDIGEFHDRRVQRTVRRLCFAARRHGVRPGAGDRARARQRFSRNRQRQPVRLRHRRSQSVDPAESFVDHAARTALRQHGDVQRGQLQRTGGRAVHAARPAADEQQQKRAGFDPRPQRQRLQSSRSAIPRISTVWRCR